MYIFVNVRFFNLYTADQKTGLLWYVQIIPTNLASINNVWYSESLTIAILRNVLKQKTIIVFTGNQNID